VFGNMASVGVEGVLGVPGMLAMPGVVDGEIGGSG
jgi:hypothetical protein